MHDIECPYWDQVSFNNTSLNLVYICMLSFKLDLISEIHKMIIVIIL